MMYAQAVRYVEKHKLDEIEAFHLRGLAMDLSDVDFVETYRSYHEFRKNNPGIQIIIKIN